MLWPIYLMGGFKDGIGPCVLLATAVFLFFYELLSDHVTQGRRLGLAFMALYYGFSLVFNIGFWANLLMLKQVERVLHMGNLILGAVALLVGIILFVEWLSLKKPNSPGSALYKRFFGLKLNVFWAYGAVFMAALLMSVLSTIWPLDYYITILSNNIFMPGKFWETVVLLAVYGVVQLWLMICLAQLFASKASTRDVRLIVSAAIFLSAGVVVFYLL